MASAPRFQLLITPSLVAPMTASFKDSRTADRRAMESSLLVRGACGRSFTEEGLALRRGPRRLRRITVFEEELARARRDAGKCFLLGLAAALAQPKPPRGRGSQPITRYGG